MTEHHAKEKKDELTASNHGWDWSEFATNSQAKPLHLEKSLRITVWVLPYTNKHDAGMLHFQISPNSGVPVYRQVMDQIKYYISSGVLTVGDQLPSIRALSKSLAVNPSTVVKAYNDLGHERVIENRQGRGAFVVEQAVKLSAEEREAVIRNLARQLWVEANQLGLNAQQVRDLIDDEHLNN